MAFKAPEVNVSRQEIMAIDTYPARVVQIIDTGLQPQNYNGETKPPKQEIHITYEFPTEFCVDEDGADMLDKPRWLSEDFVLYPREVSKSKAAQRMCALDPEDVLDDDWERVLGQPCAVTVVHNVKPKATYANIGAVTPCMKGMVVGELVNPTALFLLDSPDLEVFNTFPQFLKDKITSNLEFKGSKLEALLGGDAGASPEQADSDDNPY